MIINPGNHTMKISEQVTQSNIPLAYIKKADGNVKLLCRLEDSFAKSSKTEIEPFRIFDTDNVTLFDDDGNVVETGKYLKFKNSKYVFTPINSTEYIPDTFTYSVLMKKDAAFKNYVVYNIAFKSLNDYDNYAANLVGAFTSLNLNKPANIIFNNNSISYYSILTEADENRNDFLVTSWEDYKQNIEFFDEDYLKHTNIWIMDENFDGAIVETDESPVYRLITPELYDNAEYEFDNCANITFDDTLLEESFPSTQFYYYSPCEGYTPVYILHEPDERYIILSHPDILKNIDKTDKFVFELIMYVYLQSYYETDTRKQYISDNKIDYYLKKGIKFNEYHPRTNLSDVLFSEGFNSRLDYKICMVEAALNNSGYEDKIKYIGVNKYNDLLFRKLVSTDPSKESNQIAVFTSSDTIINYSEKGNSIYLYEERPEIKTSYINGKHVVYVGAMRSSEYNINLEKAVSILEDDSQNLLKINTEYLLYFDKIDKTYKMTTNSITGESDKIKVAEITLSSDIELECGDIRAYGGGEIDCIDNYEMIDQGSINGRPYRIGSVMIIRLPKRFKQHKEKLESEIKKHMASADYPILVFE